jgi:hypothetical protein
LFRKYGLTQEDFDGMVEDQGGACALCGQVPVDLLCVDHDHKTGEVRKLLCRKHNMALGLFADDPDLLEAAARYVRNGGIGSI